jgi:RNA polymerase sigma factor (sigma-70 family)
MTAVTPVGALVTAAAAGDSRAWESLVAAFAPLIRSIARRHRLSDADQDEVVQSTWLALLEHIAHLREPAALAGWLSTTARNESIRILREAARVKPTEQVAVPEQPADTTVADEVEWEERRIAVRHAIDRAPVTHRTLLSALIAEPARSYTEVSAELKMPVGSIGPTRARYLTRLRRDPAVAGLMAEFAPPARATRSPRPPFDLL